MKLTKYLSFAVLAGAMLLTNCNKDDESTSPIRPSDAVNINFSVGGKQLTRSNPLGELEEQAKFNEGDQIAVSVTAPAEQSAVKFELGSNGTWTETDADFLRWKASAQTFKAVYPASAKDGFDLPVDQSTVDNIAAADYMSVETECTRPNNGTDISLRLERQTARIIVNITSYGNQYASDKQNVSDVKINGITPYKQENSDQYIALVLPTSIEDAFITLKDGEDHELSVLRSDINTTFEAGNSYTFNLKVGKDGIKIGNVVVTEWADATIEGGKAYAEGEEPTEVPTDVPITVTWDNMRLTGSGPGTYTQDGVTLTSVNTIGPGEAHIYNNFFDYGTNTFTTTSGKFTKIEIICTDADDDDISGWDKVKVGEFQPEPEWDPDNWEDLFKLTWTGEEESVTICADIYDIQSITFTIADGEEQAAATLSDRIFTEGSVIDIEVQVDDTPFSFSFTYTSTSPDFTSTNIYGVKLSGYVDDKYLEIYGSFEDGATRYYFDGRFNVDDERNVIDYGLYAMKDGTTTTGMITSFKVNGETVTLENY